MLPGPAAGSQRSCAPPRSARLDQPPLTSHPCYASCLRRQNLLQKPCPTVQDHAGEPHDCADGAPLQEGRMTLVADSPSECPPSDTNRRHGIVSGITMMPYFRQG